MRIYIKPGEKLLVGFCDANHNPTDGEFMISLSRNGQEIKVQETAGLPGNRKGRANELLYHEKYKPDQGFNLTEEME